MTAKQYVALATLGSISMLLGALGFQYLGDLPPCKMCYWQRYAHLAAVLSGFVFYLFPERIITFLGVFSALGSIALASYHTGVEQKWWQGPDTCTSQAIDGLSTEDLFNQIMAAPVVRCDEIAWDMFGISMAGWNAIVSVGLLALWIAAAGKGQR